MAEAEDKSSSYEKVWDRVKVYIPFLQELITEYKNDTQQNRQQQLQKITTMYDLLTNQRLNHGSLLKCETVLIKLYETNSSKKKISGKPIPETTPRSPEEITTPRSPAEITSPRSPAEVTSTRSPAEFTTPRSLVAVVESDTPASPCALDDPVEPSSVEETPQSLSENTIEPNSSTNNGSTNSCGVTKKSALSENTIEPNSSKNNESSYGVMNKPPLSLEEVTRLISDKPQTNVIRSDDEKKLSKSMNDALKILAKDFQKSASEQARTSRYNDSQNSAPYSRTPHSPPYSGGGPAPMDSSRPSTYMRSVWESENVSHGDFPHSVNNSFRNVTVQNYRQPETTFRPKSPPLYRRRDDLPIPDRRREDFPTEDRRLTNDRMDISPLYSPPSEGLSPSNSSKIKDPRLRRAVNTPFGVHSPVEQFGYDQIQPHFPTVKNNDPRLNRSSYNSAPPIPAPNQLPKCIAPNPDLPLDHGKKEPPKRRPSICVKQVIIEELPLEPVLPSASFPNRRPSVCADSVPFHGMNFMPPINSHQPISPLLPPPNVIPPLLPPSNAIPSFLSLPSAIPPMFPPPNAIPIISPHSIEAPSVAERDPRRKHLPPGAEYIKNPHTKYNRSMAGPSKAPLTYLEYRRQKEMREKQAMIGRQQMNDTENFGERVGNKTDEEIDVTIGMVPNKSRVAAKAYAKPVKGSTWKERSPYHPKDAKQSSMKPHGKHHKNYSTNKYDKKQNSSSEREKSTSKAKDSFGEQLSQFDKMYRSGDFSKKPVSGGMGVFKIPKIKRIETSVSKEISSEWTDESEKSVSEQANEKAQCKSLEPLNSNDDDMWDVEDSNKISVPTESEKKVVPSEAPAKKAPQSLKSLDDDDLWDTESNLENNQTHSSGNEIDPPVEEKDEFVVPKLPVSRKTLRRRNSVVSNERNDEPTSVPASMTAISRRMTRRNSIAISGEQAENNGINESLGKKPINSDNEETSYEADEDAIVPRRKKRKAIIDDDDGDDPEPTPSSSANHLSLVAQESGDDVVSSTTNEAKTCRPSKKRTRKGKTSTNLASESDDQVENDGASVETISTAAEVSDSTAASTVQVADESKSTGEAEESVKIETEEDVSKDSNNKAQLLAILSQICGEKKMKKIQEIIESSGDKALTNEDTTDKDSSAEHVASSSEGSTSTSITSSNESSKKEKANVKRKTKSELDKLNADIAEMYIRDGVLNATGRRSCTKKYEPVFEPNMNSTPKAAGRTKRGRKPGVKKIVKTKLPEVPLELKNLKVVVVKMDLEKIETDHGRQNILTEIKMVADNEESPKSRQLKRSSLDTAALPSKKKKIDMSGKQTTTCASKVYTPKPVAKNTNRELHSKSDKSKDCALCSYTGTYPSIVQHYVRNHPLHEVYVSRISNAMANKIRKEPMTVTGFMHDQNITFQCIFCQEQFSKKKYNWKLHLASHTGEYRYKCSNCTIKSLTPCTNSHDSECVGPAMEVANELLFEENHIFGYMCRVCNYVQLSKANMENHLREEHERQNTTRGNLRFSILNYETREESDLVASQETIDSDVSMPELSPQVPQSTSDMSAFIPSANDEIESLKVLNDRNFASPTKPSIIDKLKKNFDELMQKNTAETQLTVEKTKRSAPSNDNIPMPVPLALKEEKIDIFEGKKVVSNIGYNQIGGETWYLCLVGVCKHATRERSEMYCHVGEYHSDAVWDGYCYLCTANVTDDESNYLAKEVKHMAVVHIKDHTAFEEMIAVPSQDTASTSLEDRPLLKLRKLPGDKLSAETVIDGDVGDPINLKVWLDAATRKCQPHCLNMLELKSLFCFYKCMGVSCCFTTTLENLMRKHLDNHDLVGDMTGTGPTKSWLECAYCEIIAESTAELIAHLKSVHSDSAHQCAYCFYRSREAYNVLLHQNIHHKKLKQQILVIESEKKPLTSADHEILDRRRVENILPLICTACNAEFYVLDAFMSHLKDDHTDLNMITCQCCKENVPKLKVPRHLLVHKIGIYECMFCQYGSNTMEAIQFHVCNRHPTEPMYCCVRYNKTPGKIKEASLKSLYEGIIDNNVYVYCPFKNEELNYKSPDTKSNFEINFAVKPVVIPLQLPPIRVGDANILLSAQIPSATNSKQPEHSTVVVNAKSAELIKMPTITNVSGGVIMPGSSSSSSVPIITAVQGNYQPQSSNSHCTATDGSFPPGTSMPVITRVEGGVVGMATIKPAPSLGGTKIIISPTKFTGVPIITSVCSVGSSMQKQTQVEDDALMLEAERVAIEMIKDTGLPRSIIYKCVFKGCNSVMTDGTHMRKHLTFTHQPSNQYTCVHCKGKPTFRDILLLTQHLKTHETQRIFCFVCDYKGSFPPEVIKHVKDVHKTGQPTIHFLNPKKNDPNNDIIIFAPGQPKETEKKAFYKKLIDLYNHKLQAALVQQKTHFTPEECDSLPKQAIFSQVVFCSKCQYNTKVRLNMFRHLKGHLNDLPVSNVDPKNPVPCWGQGEKHFDRMRNPAASSQEDDDLIQSLCFVKENKRYICGAPDCRYLTINETMLRSHLTTLHVDVKEYKCPHCPAVHVSPGQMEVTTVLEHLKLHDKELYRCSKCSLFLNNKAEIEQHVSEKHSTTPNASIFVIRDGSTAGSVASITTEDEVIFKWKCDVCKFKSVSVGDMRSHMLETHNITAKYRCSRCLYSCSNKSLFPAHFEKQHPGCDILVLSMYKAIEEGDDSRADTTPLWRRETNKTRSIRGIEVEEDDDESKDDESEQHLDTYQPEVYTITLDSPDDTCTSEPGTSGNKRKIPSESDSVNPIKLSRQDDSGIIKAFKCGQKGCSYEHDFGSGIVSHFKVEHPNEKPSVLRNILANPQQSRFDYYMKYACFYCIKKTDTIKELHHHWSQLHRMAGRRSQDKPFLFRTAKIILCFYCRKGMTAPEMKSHFTSCHGGMPAIYLDFRNPKRCAECDYVMGNNKQDMIKHFSTEHRQENEYSKGWIDYLTDDIIDKILGLNCVTFGCEKCDFTTQNNSNFTSHYALEHPGEMVEFNEFPINKKIVYYCSYNNCKADFDNERDIAQHILQHIPVFKCMSNEGLCTTQFRSFTMLVQHCQATHPHQDLHYALKTPDEYKNVLRLVSIQFWNGFVMSLEDARQAGNRYGSYAGFFKHVDDLCAESVAAGTEIL
ncbi:uncharacterized protein LOC129767379 [Toxorhynchites rutilus septentrionalis]|uniref:uncharacterized protein LOC129767379 n=1 Tax=Toxorhynchites rutilus septentrionalis TaxID=329112 RepID=UPI00247AE433|nr:uncharacterized protein LOC129767379 [Toxorhynchites rutilus septentrionalis]XP_055624211.1 uncharacterized protein LOC129767379 [Toxorhynchites rutilus septentrionalis]XP_055624212.1 uncharacterized protein LOC129767379 [Toxorhynchites rutilus septentrionalis]